MPWRSVDDKMPFMEHLGELRTRIVRSLFWLLGGTFIALFRAEQITDYLARPVTKLGYKLVFTAPAEAFWVQMKVALIVGLFLAAPGILWQVWRSEEHTSELQSHHDLVCRLLLEKKKTH